MFVIPLEIVKQTQKDIIGSGDPSVGPVIKKFAIIMVPLGIAWLMSVMPWDQWAG